MDKIFRTAMAARGTAVKILLSPGEAACASMTERAKEHRKITISMRGFEYCTLSPDLVGSSPKGRASYVVERLDTK